MSKYWKRVIKVSTGGKTWTNNLHIEFEVPFDDDYTPNKSTVKIYNLSPNSIQQIKKGNKLTLEAGYEGDTGIILRGEITAVRTEKAGTDRATIIKVLDSHGVKNKQKYKKTFKSKTKSSTIIRAIASSINLNIKVLDLPNDKLQKKGYSVSGRGIESIEALARDCGASFYYSRGHLYIRDIRKGDNINFKLSNETGLIGTPDLFVKEYQKKQTKGFSFTALLQHRVSTAAILTVDCPTVKGKFRVIKGKHRANGDDFYTEFEGVS